jgi:protein transport protein SEC24
MAASQEGYGHSQADPYGQHPQYNEQPQQPGFANAGSPPPPPGEQQHLDGGRKKKRGYAAQAYDFGAGANSALGGQPPAGGAFPPAQAPAYGGYSAQPEAQQGYGAPQPYVAQGQPQAPISPSYGQPAPMGGVGGYQPPVPGYPGAGIPQNDVGAITQGMGQMGFGGQGQAAVQPAQANARPLALNQLYPTDLLNQPFNVAELELPPPPIILPPNVRCLLFSGNFKLIRDTSRALLHRLIRIVLQNMSDQLSTQFQPHTHCSKNRNCRLHL